MTEQNNQVESQATNNEEKPVVLQIQRIYVKDISFEAPNLPAIFQQEWKPQLNFNLNTETKELAENVYEVCLTLSIETKLEDSQEVAFICEVAQAGVFVISGFEGVDLAHCLMAQCPTILFPYAREAVANLVNRGTFPALNLQPVNFDELFMEHLKNQAAEQEKQQAEENPVQH